MKSAYLIVAIRDNQFVGACVFSEPNPTKRADTVLGVVLELRRNTYEEARDAVLDYARTAYPWLKVSR